MPMTLEIALVLEQTSADNFVSAPGVISQTNGNYLYGYCDRFGNSVTHWYRSTDNGHSWLAAADVAGGLHNRPSAAAGCKGNIAIFPANYENFDGVDINRSVTNAASWSNVATYAWNGTNPFRTVLCCGIATHDLTKFIATGQFLGASSGPRSSIITSNDAGATWSTGPNLFDNTNASYGSAIAVAPGGRVYCAGSLRPTFSYWPTIKISTDYGSTWSGSGALPMPANTNTVEIRAITCVDDDVVCMAGFGNSFPFADEPYVWQSNDKGATWTRLATSDIASWPAAAAPTECSEVKRITKDAVILGVSNTTSGTTPPWRLSLDKGRTYPIVPTTVSGTVPTQAQALGSIVVARDGTILLPLYARSGGVNYRQVWAGRIVC